MLLDILQGRGRGAARPSVRRPEDRRFLRQLHGHRGDRQARASRPLKPELDRIGAMTRRGRASGRDGAPATHGRPGAVHFRRPARCQGFQPDHRRAGQGGLSLPDRDYYLKTDPKSVEIRQHYCSTSRRCSQLAGDTPETAAPKATMVLDFETILAKASLDRVTMRDPNKRYNIMTEQRTGRAWRPTFPGTAISSLGAPAFEHSERQQSRLLQADLIPICRRQPIETWKAYFDVPPAARVGHVCCRAVRRRGFRFLAALPDRRARSRGRAARCAAWRLDRRSLGDLLGQKYIEAAFGADAKAQITQLVEALEQRPGRGYSDAAVDDRGHQESRARQAARPSRTTWAIPRNGATTAR